MLIALLIANFVLFIGCVWFTLEAWQGKEQRAATLGMVCIGILLFIAGGLVLNPALRPAFALFFVLLALFAGVFLVPGAANPKALHGTMGYVVEQPQQYDERDVMFARQRLSPENQEYYRRYYDMCPPEQEARDAKRREKGILGRPGSIDQGYRPNVAMMAAAFDIPDFLGAYAEALPHPKSTPVNLDPANATEIVKHFALHLGADLVGICRVNPQWLYSHRGEIHDQNWEAWGQPITACPPYAVVFCVEMDWDHVSAAPHTPTVAESAHKYAQGAYISTLLARWFAHTGYRAVAQHSRHYDMPLVPLAIDAGLGELGRYGYLVAPKFGSRVRIFATFTDMPLIPDTPISIGVDVYCQHCKKCAESCPSGAVPSGEKIVCKGMEKWKIDEEACFAYWAKAGTDCAICMSICPLGRPRTPLNNLYRWMVARSPVAQRVFPYLDNWIYGRKWRPRKVSSWLDYPKSQIN